jgi:serine/threonine protein kinase
MGSCCTRPAIGDYHVGEILGSGVHGRVYLGKHKTTKEKVALKTVQYTSTGYAPYKRELRILRKLEGIDAPVVRLLFSSTKHLLKMGMLDLFPEYVDVIGLELARGTIEDFYHNRPFPPLVALGLYQQLLSALQYCHERTVCHRDVKPSNILVRTDYRIVLSDFSLATAKLECSNCSGTMRFVAPEVINCFSFYDGAKADVWSAGVCLYTFVTGNFPYSHATSSDPYYKLVENKDWDAFWSGINLPNNVKDAIQMTFICEPYRRFSAKHLLSQLNWDGVSHGSVENELRKREPKW